MYESARTSPYHVPDESIKRPANILVQNLFQYSAMYALFYKPSLPFKFPKQIDTFLF